jgi:hypothetical protein
LTALQQEVARRLRGFDDSYQLVALRAVTICAKLRGSRLATDERAADIGKP